MDNLVVEMEINLLLFMIDYGIRSMPPGVTTFVMLVDSQGMGFKQIHMGFMQALLRVITIAYHDRLAALYAGPVNIVIRSMYKMFTPLLTQNLVNKIHLSNNMLQTLEPIIGYDDIPNNFGGPAQHRFTALGAVPESPNAIFDFDSMDLQHMAACKKILLE